MGAVYAASLGACVHPADSVAYRMKQPVLRQLRLGAVGAALALAAAACGGGGGSASSGAPNTAPQSVSPGTAILNWTAVSQNTNGAALTDLAGYRIYYGTSPNELSTVVVVPNAGATSYQVTNLSSGTWYFAVAAYTSSGIEGDHSNVVAKTVE
jgi:hypothetical protein